MITLDDLRHDPALIATQKILYPFKSRETLTIKTGQVYSDYGVFMLRALDNPTDTKLLTGLQYTADDLSLATKAYIYIPNQRTELSFPFAWQLRHGAYYPQVTCVQDNSFVVSPGQEFFWFCDKFPQEATKTQAQAQLESIIETAALVTGPPKGRRRYR